MANKLEEIECTYSVLLGNIGICLQDEMDYGTALKVFTDYIAISQGSQGIGARAYNEQVSLWRNYADGDNDMVAEYEPYKPKVEIELEGTNGNAFVIIERVMKALEEDGRSNLAKDYKKRAMHGDYEHLKAIIGDYCQVDEDEDEDEDSYGWFNNSAYEE